MLYQGAGNEREEAALAQSLRARGWISGGMALFFSGLALRGSGPGSPAAPLALLFSAWLCANLACASLLPQLRRRLGTARLLSLSFGADAAASTLAAWLCGGAEWLGFSALSLVSIFSAASLRPSAARRMYWFCGALYLAYLLAASASLLPPQPMLPPVFPSAGPEARAATAAIFAGMFGALSFSVDRLMARSHARERSLQAANERLHSLNEQLHDKQFSLLVSQQDLLLSNEKLRLKSEEVLRSQDVLKALAVAVEAKDAYTEGHSSRVAVYALQLARALGLSPEEQDVIRDGCYLHDIGKVNVSDLILDKPGRLTGEEYAQMRRHPLIGEQICQPLAFARPWLDIIRHHHERIDGAGYPDGLAGEEISLHARIAAIADAWDAMTSDRPYRKALPREEAVRRLRDGKGTQWDAALVEKFIEITAPKGARQGAMSA